MKIEITGIINPNKAETDNDIIQMIISLKNFLSPIGRTELISQLSNSQLKRKVFATDEICYFCRSRTDCLLINHKSICYSCNKSAIIAYAKLKEANK